MVTVTIYHRRMKITKLETLRLEEFPNLLWLRLHSDAGIAGLGETHRAAPSVEAYVHEFIAPRVLGKDPLELERLTRSLTGYLGFRGSGVETRAISAFDIALWDHYARVVNQPLYQVLGGASRDGIRTYNTGPGYGDIRPTPGLAPATGTPATRAGRRRRTGEWAASRPARTKIWMHFCTARTSGPRRSSSRG